MIEDDRKAFETFRDNIWSLGDYADGKEVLAEVAFKAGLKQAYGKQEPVAYRYRYSEQEKWFYGETDKFLWEHQPLYACPPAVSEEVTRLREALKNTLQHCLLWQGEPDEYSCIIHKAVVTEARAALATTKED